MKSLMKALLPGVLSAVLLCLLGPSPAAGQRRRSAPAAGGGSNTKTREEADARYAAGIRYVDPDLAGGAAPPKASAARGARRKAATPGRRSIDSAAVELVEEADSLFDSGNYTGALALFRRAVSEHPSSLEAHLALGVAYNEMGEYGSAFEPLRRALKLDPGNAEAQYGVGHAYVNVDKPKEALTFLRAAVRLDPDYAEARYDLGVAYAMLEDYKAAKREYEVLSRLDSGLALKLAQVIDQYWIDVGPSEAQ